MNAEIERLQAIIDQQERQITLVIDRMDKASKTIKELRQWLQWALKELVTYKPVEHQSREFFEAVKAAGMEDMT